MAGNEILRYLDRLSGSIPSQGMQPRQPASIDPFAQWLYMYETPQEQIPRDPATLARAVMASQEQIPFWKRMLYQKPQDYLKAMIMAALSRGEVAPEDVRFYRDRDVLEREAMKELRRQDRQAQENR